MINAAARGTPLDDNDDGFWKAKAIDAMGLPPDAVPENAGTVNRLRSTWKGLLARYLGISRHASDDEVLDAHEKHMAARKHLNKAAATMTGNERRVTTLGLVNTLTARGIDYQVAFASVRSSYPNLFQ